MAHRQNIFLHSIESPFGTTLAQNDRHDASLFKAKQIADFVLAPSRWDAHSMNRAWELTHCHGLWDTDGPGYIMPRNVNNVDEIYSYGCVVAIANFYDAVRPGSDVRDSEIPDNYRKCVHALNAMTYLLQAPHDRASRLPGPVDMDLGEHWKLDRAWDICVCLLGMIKVRCGVDRLLDVGNIPIVHSLHYERRARDALDRSLRAVATRRGICPKAIHLLTREEIPPFIQPLRLIEHLEARPPSTHFFDHGRCEKTSCTFDTIEHNGGANVGPLLERYHTPGCDTRCQLRIPPSDSWDVFNRISSSGMPAVNIEGSDGSPDRWWVEASKRTLAVSHVWRDGVWGTCEQGISNCVHRLLVQIARQEKCTSYWIDCATIPTDHERRRRMIMRINSTFKNAGSVICWDKEIALSNLTGDDEILLSLIVSPWHRRAWTLLEGNKSSSEDIKVLGLQEYNVNQQSPVIKLHPLRDMLNGTLNNENVPLWIRAALVELLPYSNSPLSMDAAGLLLTGRHATRTGDSSCIWGLLRPTDPPIDADAFPFDDPYSYTRDEADVAFISSNATRFTPSGGTASWRPGKPNATTWVRTAYGGIKAQITHDREQRNLNGLWWHKTGIKYREHIDLYGSESIADKSALQKLRNRIDSHDDDFALICPILQTDPMATRENANPGTTHSQNPIQGFFRTCLVLECNRAIAITRERGSKYWQWQSIVNLKQGSTLKFTASEYDDFCIGSRV